MAPLPIATPHLVLADGEHALTTSLIVAEKFGKQHKHVLRAIANLECSPEFSGPNFGLADYFDDQKKPRPMYYITRDGFAFLAMGFTGKEAARWKEAFITAFNALEAQLQQRAGDRLQGLEARLAQIEAALFSDRPAWPLIAESKALGETHRQTLLKTGHKSTDTIRRNLRHMERYGVLARSVTTH